MPRKKKPAKAMNGQGTVRQLANKKWEYQFVLGRKPDGSLDRKSKTGDTAEQAIERGKQVIAEYMMKPESKVKPSDMTMSIWAERWFAQHELEVRKSTVPTDKNTKDHIVKAFGPMYLQDIKASNVNSLLQSMTNEGKSSSLTTKVRGMLYQMFNAAVIDEIILSNPVALLKQKRKGATAKSIRDKKDAYMPAEVAVIVDACLAAPEKKIANAVMALLFSGLRESELLALEKKYVSPGGRFFDVWQALNKEDNKFVMGDVKSSAALRHVPVACVAHAAAQALYDGAKEEKLFPSRIKRVDYLGVQGFRKSCMAFINGIEGTRHLLPHCLRHTNATMLAAAGVPEAKIKYILGHEDYRTTANIYTHIQFWMTPEAKKLLKKWGVGEDEKTAPLQMVVDEGKKKSAKGKKKTPGTA